MGKKILSSLILIITFFFIDYLFFWFLKRTYSEWLQNFLNYLYLIFLVFSFFILIENLIYNSLFSFKSSRLRILIFLLLPFLISMHLAKRIVEINKFYFYSKTLSKFSSGSLWKPDQFLSHKAVLNSKGSYIYNIDYEIKGKVPVLFNNNGYRTVPDSLLLNKEDSLNIFLGCSFTFGDFIRPDQGYPYITSKYLENNFINAGASAYGLGQMNQLLDSILPKNNFKFVFIQLSPWLVDRAMSLNGPVYYGYRPFPYYSDSEKEFKLNYPAFDTRYYERNNWLGTPISYSEKIKFMFTDGWKIEVLDYYSFLLANIKIKLGLLEKPTRKRKKLEKYFYNYAIEKCKENNSIPIILKLRYNNSYCRDLVSSIENKALLIDLDKDLDSIVDKTGILYEDLFYIKHFSGKDSIIIDNHPNKYSNALFSRRIYKDLKYHNLIQ